MATNSGLSQADRNNTQSEAEKIQDKKMLPNSELVRMAKECRMDQIQIGVYMIYKDPCWRVYAYETASHEMTFRVEYSRNHSFKYINTDFQYGVFIVLKIGDSYELKQIAPKATLQTVKKEVQDKIVSAYQALKRAGVMIK